MFDVKDTLLPPTATPLAKALDILEERLFSLPVQMISKDPATVDVGLLDHLAWEHSVDVWDLDWPEDIKRSVIAVSAEVHRFKGTPYAIRTALAAFDVNIELLEWFEPEGIADGLEAGSFRVTAYFRQSLFPGESVVVSERAIAAIRHVLERVTPVSRGFFLTAAVSLPGGTLRSAVSMATASSRRFRMRVIQTAPRDQLAPLRLTVPLGNHQTTISATRRRVA